MRADKTEICTPQDGDPCAWRRRRKFLIALAILGVAVAVLFYLVVGNPHPGWINYDNDAIF